MISYRVGAPGWKIAARFGFPLKVKVFVRWDGEAKVFVAVSDDFLPDFGCVAESSTWDGLQKELNAVFDDAMETIFRKHPISSHISSSLRFGQA